MRRQIVIALLTVFAGSPAFAAGDFEVLFSGNGQIRSFAYFHRNADHLIDTIVGIENQMLRYKSSFLVFKFENETDMGQGAQAGMPFDPNRGRWMFGLESRTELGQSFFEVLLRHDCYHGIDRYWPGEDFKMTSVGIGFGSRGYLQKYRYRDYEESAGTLQFPLRANWLLSPSIYVPKGDFWQRGPYRARLEANLRVDLLRWKRLGFGVELDNVFYATSSNDVQRSHLVSVDAFLYGSSHALRLFFSWWPYDDQVLKNRSNRGVAGLELSF